MGRLQQPGEGNISLTAVVPLSRKKSFCTINFTTRNLSYFHIVQYDCSIEYETMMKIMVEYLNKTMKQIHLCHMRRVIPKVACSLTVAKSLKHISNHPLEFLCDDMMD